MSDKDIPTSGSRWEPAEGFSQEPAASPVQPPAGPQDAPTEHIPADDTAVQAGSAGVPTEPVSRTRLARGLRGRSAVAAAGVGLALAGGLGGFAIAHAVAGDASDGGTVTDQNGVPGNGQGGRPNFRDGERPGPGGQPDGTGPRDTSPDTGGGGTA